LVEAASQVEVALHELVTVTGCPAWNGEAYGQHSWAVPLLMQICPFAAVQVALTTRPVEVAIIAWPPGFSVTVLTTPFVVTWIGCPTSSEAGVQPCANAVPGRRASHDASSSRQAGLFPWP
jgi:hypothetical protein